MGRALPPAGLLLCGSSAGTQRGRPEGKHPCGDSGVPAGTGLLAPRVPVRCPGCQRCPQGGCSELPGRQTTSQQGLKRKKHALKAAKKPSERSRKGESPSMGASRSDWSCGEVRERWMECRSRRLLSSLPQPGGTTGDWLLQVTAVTSWVSGSIVLGEKVEVQGGDGDWRGSVGAAWGGSKAFTRGAERYLEEPKREPKREPLPPPAAPVPSARPRARFLVAAECHGARVAGGWWPARPACRLPRCFLTSAGARASPPPAGWPLLLTKTLA